MNPIFWVLVILAVILLWFLLAFLYRPIGRLFYRIWKDAINEINIKETERKD